MDITEFITRGQRKKECVTVRATTLKRDDSLLFVLKLLLLIFVIINGITVETATVETVNCLHSRRVWFHSHQLLHAIRMITI